MIRVAKLPGRTPNSGTAPIGSIVISGVLRLCLDGKEVCKVKGSLRDEGHELGSQLR